MNEILRIRKEKRLTLQELAEKANVSVSAVFGAENSDEGLHSMYYQILGAAHSHIGNRQVTPGEIKKRIQKAGLTTGEAAKIMGMTRNYLYAIIRGQRKVPLKFRKTLRKIPNRLYNFLEAPSLQEFLIRKRVVMGNTLESQARKLDFSANKYRGLEKGIGFARDTDLPKLLELCDNNQEVDKLKELYLEQIPGVGV